MQRFYKITDIDWDTEGEEVDLPTKVQIDVDIEENDDVDDILASRLSDEYGWTVNSFNYEDITPTHEDKSVVLSTLASMLSDSLSCTKPKDGDDSFFFDDGLGGTWKLSITPI